MRIGLIAPISYLEITAASTYHLVLAHIYQASEAYRKHYKYMVHRGDTVILDNSAYELKEGLSFKDLYTCAEDLKPTHVVLPDVRFDRAETIKRSKEAIEYFDSMEFHFWTNIAVPQGKNQREIEWCYDELADNPRIGGFGLYEEIGAVAQGISRYEYLRKFEARKEFKKDRFYHMLGMEEDVRDVQLLSKLPWVCGIDSCKPFVYGLNSIEITRVHGAHGAYPHRPANYFELSPENNSDLNWHQAVVNCQEMLRWVK